MSKTETGTSRRAFLKLAATTAPLAAVAAVSQPGTAEAAQPDPSSDRMQDTVHTRAYYETAKF